MSEDSRKDHLLVLNKYNTILNQMDPMRPLGKVIQVSGQTILSSGPPDTSIGQICKVESSDGTSIMTEVTGFRGHDLVLVALGPTTGIFPDSMVHATGQRMTIHVGNEMLGRVLDGLGRPLDDGPPVLTGNIFHADRNPPGPTERLPIHEPLPTGVRAIDSVLTVGRGQRIGIFAGTGVGKSTLLGMLARYTRADINIVCLVGERGREVREFIERDLGKEGLARSVVFVATSDRSAMEKVYAASFATAAAEYFRDQGLTVNLLMDSVTRYCMALREIGITTGEQLGPGGYPPGVWFKLSRLVERSGALPTGSITGFYTVLVEADDMNDPVADNTRGMLDGHIVLSRRLASRNHYPSVEVTESVSRVMDNVVEPDHRENARRLRALLAAYRENEDIINLGAYARGSNADVDRAIDLMPAINAFLRQRVEEGIPFEETIAGLKRHLLLHLCSSFVDKGKEI